MPNELQQIASSSLSINPDTPVSTVQQTGEKNIYANRVDTMNVNIQTAVIAPQLLTQKAQQTAKSVNRTHYNLFVTCGADFSQNTPFTVNAHLALTVYTDDDLKSRYATLADDMIEALKSFPCIFANENTNYGCTDEDQTLGYGYIRQIKICQDGIKIYPNIVYLLPQQRLNESLFDLGIYGDSSFNEFNSRHWSIKKVDLISKLQKLGFQILK